MTWRSFYHWLTTSRYTRRLEAEIAQLKADNERLRADRDGLLLALNPALRQIRAAEMQEVKAPVSSTFKW